MLSSMEQTAIGPSGDRSRTDRRTLKEPFGRLDTSSPERERYATQCRLAPGDVWEDPVAGHRVGLLDATAPEHVARLFRGSAAASDTGDRAALVVNDPPYNIELGGEKSRLLGKTTLTEYLSFSKYWLENTIPFLEPDAHLYIWLGADVNNGFQPLPDFMVLMREYPELTPRNYITLRNQRGYGTQKNWMWVRQELLHYTRGNPPFTVVYTDIPRILRGYYKDIGGTRTDNAARSKSETIRPGNVWVDIQQVFYRMRENVPGAYAQKPVKAIRRIIETSSKPGQTVLDLFSHSGTTLIAGELSGRRVFTMDVDPVFVELTIRRLEHLRATGETGWQCENPFRENGVY